MMKLHITSVGDTTWTSVETSYVDLTGSLISEQLKARKEHNQTMLKITFARRYKVLCY